MKFNLSLIADGGFSNIYKIVNNDTKCSIEMNDKYYFDGIQNSYLKVSNVEVGLKELLIIKKLNPDNKNNLIINIFNGFIYDEDKYVLIMMKYDYSLNQMKYDDKINNNKQLQKILINNIIDGLKFIHDNNYVHRDIKPENILYKKSSNSFTICDFNSASKYKMKIDDQDYFLKFKTIDLNKNIIGTIHFASYYCLLRCYSFPRDDIESVFYIMLFITDKMKNTKWSNIFDIDDEYIHRLFRIQLTDSNFINNIRRLIFFEEIDYSFFKRLLIEDFKL